MRISKRRLGISYIVGTGIVLSVALAVDIVFAAGSDIGSAIGTVVGLVPAVSLVSARYWLRGSRLKDEQIWRIAMWGGLGIGVLTLLNTSILLVHYLVTPVVNEVVRVLMRNVAVGAVAGVLVGVVRELNAETRALYQKNTVLNRVLQHNLRNEMNVILGQVELLEPEVSASNERVEAIKRTVDEVIEMSENARRIQATLERRDVEPVDAVAIVRARLDRVREEHAGAHVESDLPDEAWVWADELLDSVVDNLLENAVEHAGEQPTVCVSIREATEHVEISVADDGPGIPRSERDVLDRAGETALDHGSGVGLWLVHWLVDEYGGRLSFDDNDPTGSVVTVTLPRASPARRPLSRRANTSTR